jgi:uncharacterized membrane protein
VTPDRRGGAWIAVAVVLSVLFAVLAHASLVEGVHPTVGALLSLVPVIGIALWALRRTHHRILLLAACALIGGATALEWKAFERHFPDLFFIEHAGANLVLAIVFGRTLAGEHEALVTRFARIVHASVPPEVERYTRQVTVAWTVFFLTMFALSCVLYLGGMLAAWSVLANLLTPILIASMFVVEYAVRHRVLPHWERTGILGGIRAFSRHFGSARFEAPR